MKRLPSIATSLLLLLSGCSKNNTVIRTPDDAKTAKIGVMTGTTGEDDRRA